MNHYYLLWHLFVKELKKIISCGKERNLLSTLIFAYFLEDSDLLYFLYEINAGVKDLRRRLYYDSKVLEPRKADDECRRLPPVGRHV